MDLLGEELFIAELNNCGQALQQDLKAESLWSLETEEELVLHTLPNIESHLGIYQSRVTRPALPLPNGQVRSEDSPGKNPVLDVVGTKITVGDKTYEFDRIHTQTTQRNLFNSSVLPLLERFISGIDVSIIAYGQTGSGKTYTMGVSHHSTPAIVQNALLYLYGRSDFH